MIWGRISEVKSLPLPKIPFFLIPNDLRAIVGSREAVVDETGFRDPSDRAKRRTCQATRPH